jgi:hypothetical protein
VIEVRIEADEQQVSIAVSNPGPSIAEEHLPLLFERFTGWMPLAPTAVATTTAWGWRSSRPSP